jgi:Fe-S cluster biosynthesis and repair protein YggX
MLINEGQLNLMDRDARKWLNKQMELFLSGEDYAKPKGYKPEK